MVRATDCSGCTKCGLYECWRRRRSSVLPSDIVSPPAVFFAPNAEGESSLGFSMDCTVKSARRSELKKRLPTPPSGSSACSLKVDAGISTLVPVLGITNLCHSWPNTGEADVDRQMKRMAEKRTVCIGASPIRMYDMTGGEAHDCPVAERLIRRAKAAKRMLGDKAYDSAELRLWLAHRGTKPVIPNRSNRKQPFSFNKRRYKERHLIENAFSRLKDFRRIATRYDRLARNFLASVCLAAALVWWI